MWVKTKLNVYCCCKWELDVYILSSLANLYNKNSLQNNCKQINTSLPKFKLKYQTSGVSSQLLQVLFKSAKHSESFLLNSGCQDIMQQFSYVKGEIFDGTDMKTQLSIWFWKLQKNKQYHKTWCFRKTHDRNIKALVWKTRKSQKI